MQERSHPVPQFDRGQERVGRIDTKPHDVQDRSWNDLILCHPQENYVTIVLLYDLYDITSANNAQPVNSSTIEFASGPVMLSNPLWITRECRFVGWAP